VTVRGYSTEPSQLTQPGHPSVGRRMSMTILMILRPPIHSDTEARTTQANSAEAGSDPLTGRARAFNRMGQYVSSTKLYIKALTCVRLTRCQYYVSSLNVMWCYSAWFPVGNSRFHRA